MRKYTDEENIFIIENYENYKVKDLAILFSEKFNRKVSDESLAHHCRILGFSKGNGTGKHSSHKQRTNKHEPETNWLIENYEKFDFEVLCDLFRFKFGLDIKNETIAQRLRRRGVWNNIIRTVFFTEEETIFLQENAKLFSYKELTYIFNNKFNRDCSKSTIENYCSSNIGIEKSIVKEIGSEVRKQNSIMVKISNDSNRNERWRVKSRLIYESFYGEIPKGYVVVHLNGDKEDFSIENLYAISRSSLSVLAGSGWYGENCSNMETKIKYAELRSFLKESEE